MNTNTNLDFVPNATFHDVPVKVLSAVCDGQFEFCFENGEINQTGGEELELISSQ